MDDRQLEAAMRPIQPEVMPPPTEQHKNAIDAALTLLRGANLSTPYGMDIDSVEDVWHASLTDYDGQAIVSAARTWIMTEDKFPTLHEFGFACGHAQRAIDAPPVHEVTHDKACPECGDTDERENDGRVYMTNPMDGGIATSRPCSLCRPTQHRLWHNGCFSPNHYGCLVCKPKGKR